MDWTKCSTGNTGRGRRRRRSGTYEETFMRHRIVLLGLWLGCCASVTLAQNAPKPVPPGQNAISSEDRAVLTTGVDALGKQIESLRQSLAGKAELMALLPDV